MTVIYERLNAKGYEFVNTASENAKDFRTLCNLYGPSRKGSWTPILVESHRVSRRTGFKVADIPYTHSALFLRPSAIAALQDVLEAHGELLPLATVDGSEMYVFNPRFVIDAIDRERSTLEYVPGSTAIWVNKYVFKKSAIGDLEIFHDTFGYNLTYFTDRFVERVKKAKLKGTEFIKLWSSDEG
jgi:hypothetical protein